MLASASPIATDNSCDRRLQPIHWLHRRRPPDLIAKVIERQVPRNLEHPGATAWLASVRDARPRHAQEHLLRQVAGRIGPPDDAAEIAEHAIPVLGEELMCVGQPVAFA